VNFNVSIDSIADFAECIRADIPACAERAGEILISDALNLSAKSKDYSKRFFREFPSELARACLGIFRQGEVARCRPRLGFVLSHPSHGEAARWMGHPFFAKRSRLRRTQGAPLARLQFAVGVQGHPPSVKDPTRGHTGHRRVYTQVTFTVYLYI